MKKNVTFLMMSVIILLLSVYVPTSASTYFQSGMCGDDIEWYIDYSGNLTIRGTGNMPNFSEQSPAPWSSGLGHIEHIKIKSGITSIGNYAFNNCGSFSDITIPESITSIGYNAFSNCDILEHVYITSIEAWCKIDFNLQSANPLSMGATLYLNNKTLEELVVPDTIQEIKPYTFYNCQQLKNVVFHNNITKIGNYAFYNCQNITTGISTSFFPETLIEIGGNAFSGNLNITSINIPKSLKKVGINAFYNCLQLKYVDVDSIETWCNIFFDGSASNPLYNGAVLYIDNKKLKNLEIPNSVSCVNQYSFANYEGLESVIIHPNVTSIGKSAFSYCSNLESVIMLDGVKEIEQRAFYNATKLSSVTIPASLERVGSMAFDECSQLCAVNISDIEAWCKICFEDKSSNPLSLAKKLYFNNILVESLIIPKDTSPSSFVFAGGSCIKNVEIPENVYIITESVFCDCNNITDIYYKGTADEWESVRIGNDNGNLKLATVHTETEIKVYPYIIESLSLLDSSHNTIMSIPEASFFAEVCVTNVNSNDKATILIACYDEKGKMLELQYMYSDFMIGQKITLGTNIRNELKNISIVKAFVVSDIKTFAPLCDYKEIS